MNLLLFEKHECRDDRLWLTGRRADHIRSVLKLEQDHSLRVGQVNGKMGRGTILARDEQGVELQISLDREPPTPVPLELILALPRPIMLQRIVKQATVLGVTRFHLIRSARVEKSFFHSPVLQPEKLHALLLEGLEQAMDTRLPEVRIYRRFKPFVEDVVPGLDGRGIIAHPGVDAKLHQVLSASPGAAEGILLAVGPEGGWNDFELDCFRRRGFQPFSMGERILHVDTAVVALLAQLQLLRNME